MKKSNKGVMTRKGYRNKKKIGEIKRTIKILFIGFIIGILYSYIFIYQDLIKLAENDAKVAVVQIDQKEEKTSLEQNEEEITKEYECTLDETSCLIKKYADEYGIDWKIAVAISKHETGNYTSYAFKSLNNVGGMMYWNGTKSILKSFNSLDEGIDAYVSNLKRNYYDIGLTTIEEIQTKYAPIGATNDPNDLNSYWVKGVSNYYYSLGK